MAIKSVVEWVCSTARLRCLVVGKQEVGAASSLAETAYCQYLNLLEINDGNFPLETTISSLRLKSTATARLGRLILVDCGIVILIYNVHLQT